MVISINGRAVPEDTMVNAGDEVRVIRIAQGGGMSHGQRKESGRGTRYDSCGDSSFIRIGILPGKTITRRRECGKPCSGTVCQTCRLIKNLLE